MLRLTATCTLTGLIGLMVGLTGCTIASSVQDVRQNPHRHWFNSRVSLQGTVGDRAPLIGGQVYQLRDKTGEVWVLTQQQTPQSGDRIRVQGQVKFESVPIAGLELGEVYIQEEQQLPPE